MDENTEESAISKPIPSYKLLDDSEMERNRASAIPNY